MSPATGKGSLSEKGARYLAQLDQALCNGNWADITELARKTDKHAPERKCFTLTARSEAQIASASHRPTSASSSATSSIHGLGDLLPKLAAAIEEEKRFPEDVYAAKVCTAEIHWLRDDAEKAVQALGEERAESKDGDSTSPTLGWLEVCDVKARSIRVAALESTGKDNDAKQQYLAAAVKTPGSRTAELRRWTERLLGKACMSTQRSLAHPTTRSLSESLQCFHAWSDFWQRAPAAGSPPASSFSYLDIPRRQVWKAYYELLSTILQYGLMYNPRSSSPSDLLVVPHDQMSSEQYSSSRRKQRAELKRVETTYESILLNETQFPKATQTNVEVEEWTQQVMSNWKILCSSGWTDAELGDGGRDAMGRNVLDILYRAATKTFHSTTILRYLFAVHASLGQFELAMHAFKSFVELVDKAKARAEKTGKHELGFDGDDSVVLTAAEAVRVLCRYGEYDQGERAMEVSRTIESWTGSNEPNFPEGANGTQQDGGVDEGSATTQAHTSKLQPNSLAAAHRAIGVAKGHWARLTFETDSRSKLQEDAIASLRTAQTFDEASIETAYALALLLAETGDVQASTTIIKNALALSSVDSESENEDENVAFNGFATERQLVPLWHLLALCLSTKDDYEQAAKMCGTAFEQFGDSTVLFGEDNHRFSTESEKTSSHSSMGIVDQMESFEKEGIVQVKMSQLTLVEIMEGAEAAVDLSHELLALFARLFGNLELMKPISKPPPPPTATSNTPSKLGGTLRSLAGSIRPKSARNSVEKPGRGQASMDSKPETRPSTTSPQEDSSQNVGVPISITVTNEDGMPSEKSHKHNHHHLPFKMRGQHGDWREHGNLRPTSGSSQNMNENVSANVTEDGSNMPGAKHASHSNLPLETVNEKAEAQEEPSSPEQSLKMMQHNAPHDTWPAPSGHEEQPPRQDVRLPAPHPASSAPPQPRLPSAQDRQQRISLLTKIWLFIAGLYLRADLYDDAGGAIEEAHKLVESFETEVGAENPSARRFFEKAWSGGKSVDELWADVWAARGDLSTARTQPFAALKAYEKALSYFPDHPSGIIGLSTLLMDIYEEKLPAEEPRPLLSSAPSSSGTSSATPPLPALLAKPQSTSNSHPEPPKPSGKQDPTPAELNRLAARDRAYHLLSTLTRLGSGWDNSEAWLTLARSHELSRQVGRAKEALWWVVELEESRPMRSWREVGAGGLTL